MGKELSVTEREEWRDIPDFPGYKVSSLGRVGSCFYRVRRKKGMGYDWLISDKIQRRLKPSLGWGKWRYHGVNLRKGGKTFFLKIHRLVLLSFIGSCPKGLEACHNNGDSEDNRLSNLRYDTHLSNMKEADMHLVGKDGYLTEDQVIDIREKRWYGLSLEVLSKEYGRKPRSIEAICSGRTFSYLRGPITKSSRLKKADVVSIRARAACGEFQKDIAVFYDLTESMVSRIINGSRHSNKPTVKRYDVTKDYYYLTISY